MDKCSMILYEMPTGTLKERHTGICVHVISNMTNLLEPEPVRLYHIVYTGFYL